LPSSVPFSSQNKLEFSCKSEMEKLKQELSDLKSENSSSQTKFKGEFDKVCRDLQELKSGNSSSQTKCKVELEKLKKELKDLKSSFQTLNRGKLNYCYRIGFFYINITRICYS
jgi:hypothetical protein